ncbi:MAG: hypothetical protein ABI723_00075 [Bacteroidia bacterium]
MKPQDKVFVETIGIPMPTDTRSGQSSFPRLNELLNEGWVIKHITSFSVTDSREERGELGISTPSYITICVQMEMG